MSSCIDLRKQCGSKHVIRCMKNMKTSTKIIAYDLEANIFAPNTCKSCFHRGEKIRVLRLKDSNRRNHSGRRKMMAANDFQFCRHHVLLKLQGLMTKLHTSHPRYSVFGYVGKPIIPKTQHLLLEHVLDKIFTVFYHSCVPIRSVSHRELTSQIC